MSPLHQQRDALQNWLHCPSQGRRSLKDNQMEMVIHDSKCNWLSTSGNNTSQQCIGDCILAAVVEQWKVALRSTDNVEGCAWLM